MEIKKEPTNLKLAGDLIAEHHIVEFGVTGGLLYLEAVFVGARAEGDLARRCEVVAVVTGVGQSLPSSQCISDQRGVQMSDMWLYTATTREEVINKIMMFIYFL